MLISWQGFVLQQGDQEVAVLPTLPYFSNHWGVSARRLINNASLAVIHLHCVEMPFEGSPPSILTTYLHTYFPDEGSLELLNVEFDLGSPLKIDSHRRNMESLAFHLRTTSPDRILIFVTTHSDENRGDFFAGKDSQGRKFSAQAAQVS